MALTDGCRSQAQRETAQEARRSPDAHHIASYCQQLGAKMGSPESWNCVRMVGNRIAVGRANAAVADAANRAAYSCGMAAAGSGCFRPSSQLSLCSPGIRLC